MCKYTRMPEPTVVKVAGSIVQFVGIHQDYIRNDRYLTMLYVRGRIRSSNPHMRLAEMPIELLNLHTAYLTDASVIDRTADGELLFEYELTVRDLLPCIMEG